MDTNHCIQMLNSNPTVTSKIVAGVEISICVIIKGELLFGAKNSEKMAANLRRVEAFISSVDVYDIDASISEIYADIKANLYRKFGPQEKKKRRKFRLQHLGISDNDLWIACVAIRQGRVLLSNDTKDFLRIQAVSELKLENWLTKH